jgi:hypothetical protein
MTLNTLLEELKPLAIVYCILGVGCLLNHYVLTRWRKGTETYTLTAPDGGKLRVTVSTALTPEERDQVFQAAVATLAARKA